MKNKTYLLFMVCVAIFAAKPSMAQVCEGLPIFSENFDNGIPATWTTYNLDAGILLPTFASRGFTNNWAPQHFLGKRCVSTCSVTTNFLNADDYLISPSISLPAGTGEICLSFKAAGLRNFYAEALDILISTTGGSVSALQANPPLSAITYSNTSFQTFTIDLSQYAGQTINLGFWYHSTFQFAIMLDDIRIAKKQPKDIALSDLQMNKVLAPGNNFIKGSILNGGTQPITAYAIHWKVDNGSVQTLDFTNVNITPDNRIDFTLPTPWNTTTNGVYKVKVWSETANDLNATNDTITRTVFINDRPRTVLVEQFTQASCPPCALYNPAFDLLLEENHASGKVNALKYHTVWPGYDPMYLQNPDEIDDRTAYYQILGVPSATVDGGFNFGVFPGSIIDINQNYLDSLYAQPSIFKLDVTAISTNETDINVQVSVKSFATIAANTFTLRGALHEKKVDFMGIPPGGNGETVFTDVVRKMLPDANGTLLPAMQEGQTLSYNFTIPFQDYYDVSQLNVTAFVQDDEDQKVYQSESIQLSVKTENAAIMNRISLAPNPANEYLLVEIPNVENGTFTASLTDALGKKVGNSIVFTKNMQNIALTHLSNGVYFLNIYDKNVFLGMKKVVVQH
jgi:thiol-disulfide isomerase/thioredoxin